MVGLCPAPLSLPWLVRLVHSSLFLYFHSLLIHSRRRREGGARYTIRYGPLSLRRSDRVAPLRGSRLRRVVRGQPKERGSERRRLTPSQERRKAWMWREPARSISFRLSTRRFSSHAFHSSLRRVPNRRIMIILMKNQWLNVGTRRVQG